MKLFDAAFHLGDSVLIPVGHNGDEPIRGKIIGRCLSIVGLVYLVRCDRSGNVVRMTAGELRRA